MKPIFVRLEENKKTDAVEVRCGKCKSSLSWFKTPTDDDKVAYEKLKKYTSHIGKCVYCNEKIDYEVDV